jgi:hypothetical protein
MKQKNSLILDKEFIQYCELNGIEDIDKLAKETFNRGFTILKYGETPSHIKGKEVTIEKEIIKEVEKIVKVTVEKLVEVPVEVIREVIREVPVEVIKEVIKEVPVEVIKEIIKEVPIEVEVIKEIQGKSKTKTIIKEVPVEVIIEVSIEVIKDVIKEVPVEVIKEIVKIDETEIIRLKGLNEQLQKELDAITESLGKINRAKYMKNSNLNSLYDE